MQGTTYETQDRHTAEDIKAIKANLARTIEYLEFVRSKADLLTDTAQREQCFEASNELVAIGHSLQEGMMAAMGVRPSEMPAPPTRRGATSEPAQSVARPRG